MLDIGDVAKLSEQVWLRLTSRVELPEKLAADMRNVAGNSLYTECKRQYARRTFHKPVIVIDGKNHHACFSKDLSRTGLGFYSPINFLPKKLIRMWLPNGEVLLVRITRCRRLGERCYEIGSRFCAAE